MEIINIDYKKYKKLSIKITDNAINGFLTDDSDLLELFLKNKKKENYNIKNPYKKISILYKEVEKNFKTLKVKDEIKNEKIVKLLNFDLSLFNKNIYELSSGEKQQIAILKVLNEKSDLIILDEPFLNLDFKIKTKLITIIKKIKTDYKKTIIIKSYNINDLYFICDCILAFNKFKLSYSVEKKDFINKFKKLKPIEFSEYVLQTKNIKLGYYDNVKDLIKAVYRDVGY